MPEDTTAAPAAAPASTAGSPAAEPALDDLIEAAVSPATDTPRSWMDSLSPEAKSVLSRQAEELGRLRRERRAEPVAASSAPAPATDDLGEMLWKNPAEAVARIKADIRAEMQTEYAPVKSAIAAQRIASQSALARQMFSDPTSLGRLQEMIASEHAADTYSDPAEVRLKAVMFDAMEERSAARTAALRAARGSQPRPEAAGAAAPASAPIAAPTLATDDGASEYQKLLSLGKEAGGDKKVGRWFLEAFANAKD